jgi:ABC-2 family transporter protein
MIWLVWRQHRMQALFALLGLAALAAFLVPTGIQMHNAFDRSGLDDCLRAVERVEYVEISADRGQAADPASTRVAACEELAGQFNSRYGGLGMVGILLWFLPLFVGLFWGAPLVAREVEHGTHRLVWTQGVSRLRWALAKFGLVGGGVVLLAVAYSLLVTWWRGPLDQAAGRQTASFLFDFDLKGAVPVGYALFALALGIFAGVLTRRSLPAMAITLVGFLALRLLVDMAARPRFLAPLRRTFPVIGGTSRPNELTGDWVITAGVYNAQGEPVSGGAFGNYSQAICGPPPTSAGAASTVDPCVSEFGAGAYNLELFQPADRFWTLQAIETALFVAVAVLLLLASVHWVRRRLS